jgi:hypothetical protein
MVYKNGQEDKVKAVEEEIKRKNIPTNSVSYSTLIEDFVNKADVEKGIRIFVYLFIYKLVIFYSFTF